VALADLFQRLRTDDGPAAAPPAEAQHPTKALPRFLSTLSECEQPLLVDLGPVVGANVSFFGEHLSCKIVVEDLFTDLDRHAREGRLADLPAFFEQRFAQEDGSVDGVLCWDVFDYLDRAAASTLAGQLVRMLRPGGVLLAFFNTAEPAPAAPLYTKRRIVDQATLEHRCYEAACGKLRPVLSREVERLFSPLRVTEQFLLQARVREVLFRKPAPSPAVAASLEAVAN